MISNLIFNSLRAKKYLLLACAIGGSVYGGYRFISSTNRQLKSEILGYEDFHNKQHEQQAELNNLLYTNFEDSGPDSPFKQIENVNEMLSIVPSITINDYKKLLKNKTSSLINDVELSKSSGSNKSLINDIDAPGNFGIDDLSTSVLRSLDTDLEEFKKLHSEEVKDNLTSMQSKNKRFSEPWASLMSDKSLFNNYSAFFKTFIKSEDIEGSRNKIISAMIYGLLEWAKYEKLLIRPDINVSINLNQISKTWSNNFVNIENFLFEFSVMNLLPTPTTLFGQFNIAPKSEWRVKINLKNGKIKHIGRRMTTNSFIKSSFSIVPQDGNMFIVEIKKAQNNKQTSAATSHEVDDIKFIYSTPPNLNVVHEELQENLSHKRFLNVVTWKDMADVVNDKLKSLSSKDIKADIENWFGTYTMANLNLQVADMEIGINFLKTPLFIDQDGDQVRFLENMINDRNFLKDVYNKYHLSDWQRLLATNMSKQIKNSGDRKSNKSYSQEILAFADGLVASFKEVLNHLEQTFIWEKVPTISTKSKTSGNGYPVVSFKLKQEWRATKDITFYLKGSFDNDTKTVGPSSDASSENKVAFDFVSMFLDPEKVLADFASVIDNQGFISQIIPGLLSDLKDFIGWEKLVFKQKDKVVTFFEANNSPMSFGIRPSNDSFDAKNGRNIIGYKILDVSWGYDLREFWTIFAQLFSKIQCFRYPDKSAFSAAEMVEMSGLSIKIKLDDLKKQFKNNPIKNAVHIINSLIGVGYGSENTKKFLDGCENAKTGSNDSFKMVDESKSAFHPWHIFFKTLLGRQFTIESKQMFVGYPRLLFNYPKNFDAGVRKSIINTNVLSGLRSLVDSTVSQYLSNKEKIIFKSFDMKELNKNIGEDFVSKNILYPVIYKHPEIAKLSKKININFGMSYPKRPFIAEKSSTVINGFWSAINKDERYSTTAKFVANKDNLGEFVVDYFQNSQHDNEYFENSRKWGPEGNMFFQDIDPKKIKVSTISLEIGQSLQTMLSTQLNLGVSGSALSLVGVNIPELLTRAIKREMYVLSVNTMREDGLWSLIKIENGKWLFYFPESDFFVMVPWNFQQCDMDLGSLKKSLEMAC